MYEFIQSRNIKIIFEFIKQFIFLIRESILGKEKVFLIWLGDYHSFLPILVSKLFSIKSYLILGGSDVENIPQFKYGVFYREPRRSLVKFSIQNSSLLLPVDFSLIERLKINFPEFNKEFLILPTGYDYKFWDITKEKENSILCVAIINDVQNYYIKGIDRFLALALEMKDYHFKLVGIQNNFKFNQELPKNVEISKPLNRFELQEEYSRAKIFLLFSRSEGLPNVICEAMLCGCYPIVSNVGGNKNLVNKFGYVFDDFELKKIIKKTTEYFNLECPNLNGRNFIKSRFSKKRRNETLMNLLITNKSKA